MARPFEVSHNTSELRELTDYLKSLGGETRAIMEYTGKYYQPIARYLHEAGIFVSVVHAKLIHDYGNNSIRKVKTDKADAIKIANYGLTNWVSLKQYVTEDDNRLLLKTCNRQYRQYMKQKVALKNNLIALLDQTFPGINKLFTSPVRENGHEKWVDFAAKFWHCDCVRNHALFVMGRVEIFSSIRILAYVHQLKKYYPTLTRITRYNWQMAFGTSVLKAIGYSYPLSPSVLLARVVFYTLLLACFIFFSPLDFYEQVSK